MEEFAPVPFGTVERIRHWKDVQNERKPKSMTRKKFAELVGVSEKSVKRWFNKNNPTPIRKKNLERIAEIMNCDIEYLECKQNTPRKSYKISLVPLSTVDRYLPIIQSLMESTGTRFTYEYDPDIYAHGEDEDDYYIEGETKYPYKHFVLNMDFSEMFFQVRVNNSEPVRISEKKMEIFVNSVIKKISKEIVNLVEVKEMYPNITKEMDRVNMTAEELAQAVGMDPEDLIEALRGEKDFTFFQASKIKKALGSELLIEELFETKGE